MIDLLDVHTHTLASGHAYSSIREMTKAAKAKNLQLLGITDHAPSMPGASHQYYFENLRTLDRSDYEVDVLFGIELNIMDCEGTVDLPDYLLTASDLNIASLHPPCINFMDKETTTRTIIRVMNNPLIHIIGHLDDSRYPVDYDLIAQVAKETNTLLELNNSSLAPKGYRYNCYENYQLMLEACLKHATPIIVNSDAHVDTKVGFHDYAISLLEEFKFPEELIVNTSVEKLTSRL